MGVLGVIEGQYQSGLHQDGPDLSGVSLVSGCGGGVYIKGVGGGDEK